MAQVTDRTIGANPTGFDMRTELNNIISALESDNSGSSEPLNTVAGMKWMDTSNATYYYVKERNHDNTAWVTLFRYTVATKIMEVVSNGVVLQDTAIEIHNATSKTTPIDTDEIGLIDSASIFTLKKLTWDNLKATLKTYLDTLYQATLVSGTNIKTINSSSLLGSGDLLVSPPDATSIVKGINYKNLLAEYVVSGSAVTSIDFSGLDINTHKSYVVEAEIINPTGSTADISLFVNADTTQTNYYSQIFFAQGNTSSASISNASKLMTSRPSGSENSVVFIQKVNNYLKAMANGIGLNGSSMYWQIQSITKIAQITNITQLTFTSSIAGSIGVGSKIRIYRGDV